MKVHKLGQKKYDLKIEPLSSANGFLRMRLDDPVGSLVL